MLYTFVICSLFAKITSLYVIRYLLACDELQFREITNLVTV